MNDATKLFSKWLEKRGSQAKGWSNTAEAVSGWTQVTLDEPEDVDKIAAASFQLMTVVQQELYVFLQEVDIKGIILNWIKTG